MYIYIYIYIYAHTQIIHVWYIYLHLPHQWLSFVGKYTSTMDDLGYNVNPKRQFYPRGIISNTSSAPRPRWRPAKSPVSGTRASLCWPNKGGRVPAPRSLLLWMSVGKRWENGDLWWFIWIFMVIYGDLWWFMSDLWWFMVIYGDLCLIYGDLWWLMVIHDDISG